MLRKTGDLSSSNPFRFSTKYQDDETGLLYYTFRYYDAGIGRWVSRDPLGEPGMSNSGLSKWHTKPDHFDARDGIGAYVFVGNATQTYTDRLGLQTQGPALCGLDVSKQLTATLQKMAEQFNALGYFEKCDQCLRLYDLSPLDDSGADGVGLSGTKAAFAWDIIELKEIGSSSSFGATPPAFFAGTSPCERTVTLEGHCFYASAVNYSMWGKMNKLCHDTINPFGLGLGYNLESALGAVRAWKSSTVSGWAEEEDQALWLTTYGYTGRLPLYASFSSMGCGCSPNAESWSGPFHWLWKPKLPRP